MKYKGEGEDEVVGVFSRQATLIQKLEGLAHKFETPILVRICLNHYFPLILI